MKPALECYTTNFLGQDDLLNFSYDTTEPLIKMKQSSRLRIH